MNAARCFLVPAEVHALADAALPGLYHAIDRALYLTAAFTGLRQGELRGCSGSTSTSMPRAGEPVTTIQAWLGHGDLKTTQRYMHYAPAADEAERVERAFAISPDDGRASRTPRALGGGDAS